SRGGQKNDRGQEEGCHGSAEGRRSTRGLRHDGAQYDTGFPLLGDTLWSAGIDPRFGFVWPTPKAGINPRTPKRSHGRAPSLQFFAFCACKTARDSVYWFRDDPRDRTGSTQALTWIRLATSVC